MVFRSIIKQERRRGQTPGDVVGFRYGTFRIVVLFENMKRNAAFRSIIKQGLRDCPLMKQGLRACSLMELDFMMDHSVT